MQKGDYLKVILASSQTVFTLKDIALIWEEPVTDALRERVSYYVEQGELNRVRRGVYVKENYNKLELAVTIYTPSYVSFETVLAKEGVVFQFYSQVFVASYLSRTIEIEERTYHYKKIKDVVLTNEVGIESKENFEIASPERAFLDVLYLNKDYHFDNLSPLDWDKVFEIVPIYGNEAMKNRVKRYYN